MPSTFPDSIPVCRTCACPIPPSEQRVLEGVPESAQGFRDLNESPMACSGVSLRLLTCPGCGLVQLGNDPVPYYCEVIRATRVSESMAAFRVAQFEALKTRYMPTLPQPRVLEVGAGRGDYAALLARIFGRATCTELSSTYAREARADDAVEVVETHPDLASFRDDLGRRTFDLVCCFSYLEHLPRPVEALRSMRQAAHEHTVFLIEVPNSTFIFEEGLINELIPDHLSYFTGTTLARTLALAGIELVSLTEEWEGYILSAVCRPSRASVVPRLFNSHQRLVDAVDAALAQEKPSASVAVWGAGHQALFTVATTSLRARAKYLVDSAPFKQGKRAPGSGLPVYAPSTLLDDPVDVVFISCAGYNPEVLRTLRGMNLGSSVYLVSGLTVTRAA